MLQSGASFCRILSAASDAPVRGTGFTPGRSSPGACAVLHSSPVCSSSGGLFVISLSAASDAPVRGTGFTPGRSSPGASAVLHSAPVAPIRGVFLSYSLRCLGRSSPWHRVHPRTMQSGGLRRASFLPGCSNPGGLFVIFSLPPRTLQSVAPGSPPDDPVRGLMLCFIPPRLLQSGASFCRILPVASDAPVRGTGLTPGRPSPGACAVLHSAPVAPIRGGLFVIFSPLPRTLQSVAPGSPPDDPVQGLAPCFIPPRLLQSGGSFLSYFLRCLGRSSPWHRVHPRTTQSGG